MAGFIKTYPKRIWPLYPQRRKIQPSIRAMGPKFTQKREKRAEKKERERGRQKQTDHFDVFTLPTLEIVLNDKKLNPWQICWFALADRHGRVAGFIKTYPKRIWPLYPQRRKIQPSIRAMGPKFTQKREKRAEKKERERGREKKNWPFLCFYITGFRDSFERQKAESVPNLPTRLDRSTRKSCQPQHLWGPFWQIQVYIPVE